MTCGPKPGPVFLPLGPLQTFGAEFGCQRAEPADIFCETLRVTVKFHKQLRRYGQRQAGEGIAGGDGVGVEKLDPGRGQAHLHHRHHAIDSRNHRREGGHGCHHRLGLAVQPQGQFGDQAQRPFRPHEKRRQVIARRRFWCAGPGVDDPAVGQHHLKPPHIVAHGAVAHGGCPRSPRCRHPAQRGIGAGIDREHQPRRPKLMIQCLAGDAGLDPDQPILGPQVQHGGHLAEIDNDSARQGQRVTFQRGSRAPADQRHPVRRGPFRQRRDFSRRAGEDDGIGQACRHQAFALSMFGQHRPGDRGPVTENFAQGGKGWVAEHSFSLKAFHPGTSVWPLSAHSAIRRPSIAMGVAR